MDQFIDHGIIVPNTGKDHYRVSCPACTPDRKNKGRKDLTVDMEKLCWFCHHCGHKGYLKGHEAKIEARPRKYSRPTLKYSAIAASWRKWLNGRKITDAVIERNRVTSSGNSVCFNYYRAEELVNIKYRDIEKKFWSEAGTEHIVYGYNDIKTGEGSCLVWVEGEIDKLSVEVAGVQECVSVPDGAPNANAKDVKQKFTFLDDMADVLESVEKHVIATDNDPNGVRLRDELIRRFGAEKCWIVRWPDGIKDANEMLQKHGPDELLNCLQSMVPAPITGVISPNDVWDSVEADYEHGIERGFSTGWFGFDSLYTVRLGEWSVITGIPGHGKSEFLDALMVNLANNHGLRFAVCSPENQPVKLHIEKILEKIVGKPFSKEYAGRMTPAELANARTWIDYHFSFLGLDTFTVDNILGASRALVLQRGINGIVIDPWNEIEGSREAGVSETEYISQVLGKFRKFARANHVHLWIVAHPTKLPKERVLPGKKESKNKYAPPTLYDISGSSHWRNKCDNGITVYRNFDTGLVEAHVQKIRFKVTGRIGIHHFQYDMACGRYSEVNSTRNEGGW